MKVRTLVVDDEAIARRGVVRLLSGDEEIEVVAGCADGAEAVDRIRALRPELVLLDVQMPRMDGFACLAALAPEERPVVVFMTAYDSYALRAFEAQALDYLLKPFSDERFFAAVGRAKETVRARRLHSASGRLLDALLQASPPRPAPPPAPAIRAGGDAADDVPSDADRADAPVPAGGWAVRVMVPRGGRWTFVGVGDIDWIGAAGSYAEVHARGEVHLLREPLARLADRLDPRRFVRVHRSAVVNLDRVREIQPWFNGQLALVMEDGGQVIVSRRRRAALEAALGQQF
ncbi:LytR/AlgR family response regulator transcription factor [Longimicrobium terrae]|uniref:Two-component system LytT family response regulator n=1 Tax=Longimicrobium terrae TaxID=1639882 RepID=A0A841H7F2_9BACT|nr:LytTR family DNA-binding domain-containing protein [Longimicrobium terrae]MBB4639482.1 two-component system LytT family response regulator [Longimicrobium terrae]MBB6073854.1 two-component system LytT family response regulator [Longimicrobium terrae]NNC32530.1 response regulator transcription factor [Longimicrobium terrae]